MDTSTTEYPEKTHSLQRSERDFPPPDGLLNQDASSTTELLEHYKVLLRNVERPREFPEENLVDASSVDGGIFDMFAESCSGVLENPSINTSPYEPLPPHGPVDIIDTAGLRATECTIRASHDANFANKSNCRDNIAYTGTPDQETRSIVPLTSSDALWNDSFSEDGLLRTFHERPSAPYLADSLNDCSDVHSGDYGLLKPELAPGCCVEYSQRGHSFHADLPIDEPTNKSASREPTVNYPAFESAPNLQASECNFEGPYALGGSRFGSGASTNNFRECQSPYDEFPMINSQTSFQAITPECMAATNNRGLLSNGHGASKQRPASIAAVQTSIDKLEQESGSRISSLTGMALTSKRSSSISFRSSYSGISSAINRLSGYSASHKAQMAYLTNAFSRSSFSISTKRTSNYSKLSSRNTELPQQDRPDRAYTNTQFTYLHLAELPGDFITSEVNTFATHIDCVLKNAQDFSPEFCRGCCLKTNRVLGNRRQSVRQSVPHALMKYKRSLPRSPSSEDWASKRPDWIDRFGNSTLHVAAALGATFHDLSSIIDRGADVNHVNTAGQTFMHTLNPWEFYLETPSVPISTFLEKLIDHSFDFGWRDDQGRNFLYVLNIMYKVNPFHFLEWLPLLCQRDNTGTLIDYDLAYRVVDSVSQFSKQRVYLDKFIEAFNEAQRRKDDVWERDITRDAIQELAKFQSNSGMNSLHILVDFPHSVMNKASVDKLVSRGVDVDAYDVWGETPLMKCVQSPRGKNATDYEASLSALLDNGASIARRNRDFETPLHIAVRAGNIVATKALLKRQANVHARDRLGRGVIAVAEAEQRRSMHDVELYAKIAACIALAIDAGAVRMPNLFEEWSLPEGKTSSRPTVYNYSQALPIPEEDSCAVTDTLYDILNDETGDVLRMRSWITHKRILCLNVLASIYRSIGKSRQLPLLI